MAIKYFINVIQIFYKFNKGYMSLYCNKGVLTMTVLVAMVVNVVWLICYINNRERKAEEDRL